MNTLSRLATPVRMISLTKNSKPSMFRSLRQVTEIRESIEQTRANMTETIDELQERLSPSHLKEQVREQVIEQYKQARETVREATIGKVEDMVERVSDTMYETRRSIVDTVTTNPIPSALVGIGLAWSG